MSAPNQPLCIVCHHKPRHASFSFCGKTCAGKAATLCNNCYSKNKFAPFDYCGKKCAALANAKPSNGNKASVQTPPGVAGPQIAANANVNSHSKNLPPKPYVAPAPPAPYPPPLPPPPVPVGTRYSDPGVASAPANAATSVLQNVKRAFSGGPQQQPAPPKGQLYGQANGQANGQYGQPPGGPPLDCLIPGCKKPVHVDENGVPASDYCSQRHREQAVNTGMASPCIMCLSLPQGDADHFCSRLCREEALSKRT